MHITIFNLNAFLNEPCLFEASETNKGVDSAKAIIQFIQCQPKVSNDDFVYTFKNFKTCLSTSIRADQQKNRTAVEYSDLLERM